MGNKKMTACKHERTRIWEPHLAGARKCLNCGLVKDPNRAYTNKPIWFDEEAEKEKAERKEYERLKKKYDTPFSIDKDDYEVWKNEKKRDD